MEIHKDKSKGAGKDETEDKIDPLHTMRAFFCGAAAQRGPWPPY